MLYCMYKNIIKIVPFDIKCPIKLKASSAIGIGNKTRSEKFFSNVSLLSIAIEWSSWIKGTKFSTFEAFSMACCWLVFDTIHKQARPKSLAIMIVKCKQSGHKSYPIRSRTDLPKVELRFGWPQAFPEVSEDWLGSRGKSSSNCAYRALSKNNKPFNLNNK